VLKGTIKLAFGPARPLPLAPHRRPVKVSGGQGKVLSTADSRRAQPVLGIEVQVVRALVLVREPLINGRPPAYASFQRKRMTFAQCSGWGKIETLALPTLTSKTSSGLSSYVAPTLTPARRCSTVQLREKRPENADAPSRAGI